MVTDFAGLTSSSSKRSQVLENLAAGSVNLTKEESDEIIQLVEGTNVHEHR
jgi:diketogulonate reductase-like aldo/keto reductase